MNRLATGLPNGNPDLSVPDRSKLKRGAVMQRLSGLLNVVLLAGILLSGSAGIAAGYQNLPFQNRAFQNCTYQDKGQLANRDDKATQSDPRGAGVETRPPIEWVAPPGHTIDEIAAIEHDCFDGVNKEREARGLRPLDFDPALMEVARAYSRRMAEGGFFSHQDPDGNDVRQRAASAGIKWRMLAENLAYEKGYVSPTAITITDWMNSPPHRRNILEPEFSEGAIGVWISSNETIYFTQLFLKN